VSVAESVSTPLRLRARAYDGEHRGRKREQQRAAIVREREQKSAPIASTALDDCERLQLGGGYPTRMQDWSQLAFEEIDESMLIRPDLDQNEVVKASLDRAIDGREMLLW